MKASALTNEASSPDQFVSRQIDTQRNNVPFLKMLEQWFEVERDTSMPPPFPFDATTDTIRLPQDVETHLKRLVRTNNKIEAVKQVTKLTGAGLRLAKDYVDSLRE